MAKFFRFPWAASGDKTTIPDVAPPSGAVSYPQGFGPDYERDPSIDPLAKRVPRDETNQLYYDITSNLRDWQVGGLPYWAAASQNGGTAVTYPAGSIVRHDHSGEFVNYIALTETSGQPGVSDDWGGWVNRIFSNTTKTINPTGGGDFLNVAEAIAWLKNIWIDPNVTVTMSFSAGNHDISGVDFEAPFLAQVLWRGQALTAVIPSASNFFSGTVPTQGGTNAAATIETFLRGIWPTRLISNQTVFAFGNLKLRDLVFIGDQTASVQGIVAGSPNNNSGPCDLWMQNIHFHNFSGSGFQSRGGGFVRSEGYVGATRCGIGFWLSNKSYWQTSARVCAVGNGTNLTVSDDGSADLFGDTSLVCATANNVSCSGAKTSLTGADLRAAGARSILNARGYVLANTSKINNDHGDTFAAQTTLGGYTVVSNFTGNATSFSPARGTESADGSWTIG